VTLNEIELDVYRRLDYADTPPVSVKNRIDGFINQRHRQLLASNRMRLLRLATTTLVTVPDRASYGLPYGCARISRVMDQDNGALLTTQSYEWVREHNPNPQNVTGTPEVWVPLGFSPVATRPIPPVIPALWIAATIVPPGTATFTLVLVGDFNGTPGQTFTLTPVLATPDPMVRKAVTLPAGFTPSDVLEFSSSAPLTGAVALFDADTGGSLISQISKGQTTARYYRIGFYPVPSAPITYWIDYEREILPLVDPYDEPLLPIDFHDIIALWARLDEYEFKSDDRWMVTRSLVEERQRQLRSWVDNHDAYTLTALPPDRYRPSGKMGGLAMAGPAGPPGAPGAPGPAGPPGTLTIPVLHSVVPVTISTQNATVDCTGADILKVTATTTGLTIQTITGGVNGQLLSFIAASNPFILAGGGNIVTPSSTISLTNGYTLLYDVDTWRYVS